ncbi:FkbM family methyltransferase [Mucilaginibacter sp.]|uniref:FkbM family methyltransferase n=1 Tax=Mucilaginibacter sp. TaxID=1882438 RepID=UPI002613DD23|nr:FkbM family methyltransferase [Mucilaginibacter sp.]MDB4926955.1 methyltransferase, FkbM family [Mucilaginibacter sp.]
MFPEILSQSIIKLLVNTFDPDKKGTAIEIGVGTDNFYSIKYKEAGLECLAVDPIAYKPFLKIAKERNIHFEEACIYDTEGEITLYSNEYSDLSSINSDWWGVNEKNQKKVKSILLKTLLIKYNIDKITFLKADTEGSEYEIIKQLTELDQSKLPYIIEFEYGGGAFKQSGTAGWDKKFFGKVIALIQTLQDLNYAQGLIIDSNDIMPVFFDLKTIKDPNELFKPTYEYGNFLVFKNPINNVAEFESLLLKTQAFELKKLLDNLYTENAALGVKVLKAQYLSRIINKVRKMLKSLNR